LANSVINNTPAINGMYSNKKDLKVLEFVLKHATYNNLAK